MTGEQQATKIAWPWSKDERGVCVWGVPVEPAWWHTEIARGDDRRLELRRLAERRVDLEGGPGCLAALIASAIEQVRAWQRRGLEVRGRRWADLGGATGHFALALALEGASQVTLLDQHEPGPWALPVLQAAGVRVVLGDADTLHVPGADAALLLYTTADPPLVLEHNPDLRLLLVDPLLPRARAWIEHAGWRVGDLSFEVGHVAMSEGCAVPGYERPEQLTKIAWCSGEGPFPAFRDNEDTDVHAVVEVDGPPTLPPAG